MPRHFSFLTLAALAGVAVASTVGADNLRVAQAAPASPPTFGTLDTNSDGQISLNEASSNDDLFVAFKKLDINRDGNLTKAEFAAYAPGR